MKNKLIRYAAMFFLIFITYVGISYAEGEIINQQAQTLPDGLPYQAVNNDQQDHMDDMNANEVAMMNPPESPTPPITPTIATPPQTPPTTPITVTPPPVTPPPKPDLTLIPILINNNIPIPTVIIVPICGVPVPIPIPPIIIYPPNAPGGPGYAIGPINIYTPIVPGGDWGINIGPLIIIGPPPLDIFIQPPPPPPPPGWPPPLGPPAPPNNPPVIPHPPIPV